MRKYKQAIQIGDNITDIFNLPCVRCVIKVEHNRKTYFGELLGRLFCLDNDKRAYTGDWLLEDVCGTWHVMTDEEYQKHKDDEIRQ